MMIEVNDIIINSIIGGGLALLFFILSHRSSQKQQSTIDEVKKMSRKQDNTLTDIEKLTRNQENTMSKIHDLGKEQKSTLEKVKKIQEEQHNTISQIKRIQNKQDKNINQIYEMQERITQQFTSGKKLGVKKPTKKTSRKVTTSLYQTKRKMCLRLLDDPQYEWRTDKILKGTSKMNDKEFEYFVENEPGVRESKIPDVFGNRLFKKIKIK